MRRFSSSTGRSVNDPPARLARGLVAAGLVLAAGCADDDTTPFDGGGDADATDDATHGCTLEGTYAVTATVVLSGACDLELADDSLAIRRLPTGYLVDFDDTSWERPVGSPTTCSVRSNGPETWSYNGALRTRTLAVTVTGDDLTAELTDRLDGADSTGRTCDVRLQLLARRSGPAPEGAPTGTNACGPLGCSSSRCVFGEEFGCETGLCLLDSTGGGWGASFCTAPCATDEDCPDGFQCLAAYEGWHGAPEGRYCARWRAVCGNGLPETGEVCDDGNTQDGDGCSTDCSSDESCGNGLLEGDEFCEATHPEEWLPCTTECTFDPPPGVLTPLPIASQGIVAASTGRRSFVVAATTTLYDADTDDEVRVARTADGGATWTTVAVPVEGWGLPQPVSLAADGPRLALGMADGTEAFHLSESADGGATWTTAVRRTVPGAAVTTPVAMNRLELALLPDGGLLALLGGDAGVLAARREPGGADWTVVDTLAPPTGPALSDCRLSWDPPRFAAYDGAGVQAIVNGSTVHVLAAGQCYDGSTFVQWARSIRSDDGGSTFGPATDLGAAAGLTGLTASAFSPESRGTAALCLTGTTAAATIAMRCAFAPSDPGSPWSFFDTPPAFTDPSYSRPADAILAPGPAELLLAQNEIDATGGHLYRTVDGGATWTAIETGRTVSFNRTLRRVSGTTAWLVEVDGNNEASLLRIDLAAGTVADREWLMGDARRGDGSGMSWRVVWADDGAGAGVLGFSLPDPLRWWITVVRRME